jgi:hypothetical protein
MSDINANMNVKGGPTVAVKQVGYAKVNFAAKSTPKVDSVGDPVSGSMDSIKNPPGVRDGARQTKLSAKQGADKPIKSLMISANTLSTPSE